MERPEKFLETEKRLLEKVKRGRMKLPSDSIDVLIVDEMGKISPAPAWTQRSSVGCM